MEGENATEGAGACASAADAVLSLSSANTILVVRGSKKEEGAPVLKQLIVNKHLLAGHSPVFEQLFFGPYKERESGCFEIVEPRADALETLIGLLELKDSVVVNKTNVDALLSLSDQYNVGVVHKKCVEFLHTVGYDAFNLQMAEKHRVLSHQIVGAVGAGLNPDDPNVKRLRNLQMDMAEEELKAARLKNDMAEEELKAAQWKNAEELKAARLKNAMTEQEVKAVRLKNAIDAVQLSKDPHCSSTDVYSRTRYFLDTLQF